MSEVGCEAQVLRWLFWARVREVSAQVRHWSADRRAHAMPAIRPERVPS